jgi:phosphatidylglycerophosphate synthase
LTPNQVTTASMLTGLVAAALFAVGARWALIAGAVLLQAAFTLDCVDGQLARYTRRFSRFGAWLDSIFDRAKEYAAYGGLAIGASRLGDPVWVLAGAALSLQTVRHLTDLAFAVRRAPEPILQPPLAAVGTPARAGAAAAQRGVLDRSRRLDAVPVAIWAKKLIGFPIGERFAVISLTAALFTPRATFVVVLAWGGFAALYGLGGRVARTVASRRAAPVPERERLLRLYRDDGVLAAALGAVAERWVRRIPPALLVVAGVVPVLVLIAASGAAVSHAGALAALAWMVVLAGASAGASQAGPTAWAAPPAIRLGEYAGLLWLAAIAGAEPAAFALLGALAFRAYDLIYRPKFQGRTPARWVGAIALGWDVRLVLAGVLLVAGALEAGFFAWAAVIGAAFTAEAAMSWRRAGAGPGLMTDDEEDDGP